MKALLCLLWLVVSSVNAGDIHGGTILAMRGKDCVLIATDSRFSSYKTGSFLLGEYARPMFRVGSRTIVGCIGLDSDAHALREAVTEQLSAHDDACIEPDAVVRVVSNILYRTRMYVTPVVIGLDSRRGPCISSMDGLGALTCPDAFAVCGTASSALYAICESVFRPGMDDEQLMAAAQRALELALRRDVLSGRRVQLLLLRPAKDTDKVEAGAEARAGGETVEGAFSVVEVRRTFQTDDV